VIHQVVSGAIVMGYATGALFFLRFWRRSHDTLFAYFAAAFFILAIQRLALGLTAERNEDRLEFYVMRLVAFVLILVAIWQKNRESRNASDS